MAKPKNEKIQAWLGSKRKNYREGLSLYLEFDLEAKLKSKLVIGGETPNNRLLLEKELSRLVDVDPKTVEARRKQMADELKEKHKLVEQQKKAAIKKELAAAAEQEQKQKAAEDMLTENELLKAKIAELEAQLKAGENQDTGTAATEPNKKDKPTNK